MWGGHPIMVVGNVMVYGWVCKCIMYMNGEGGQRYFKIYFQKEKSYQCPLIDQLCNIGHLIYF